MRPTEASAIVRPSFHRARAVLVVLAGICGLTVALRTQALQLVEARDGVAVEAIVSVREPTRIRIDGAPVTDVFGNIHSSHCASVAPAANLATAAGQPAAYAVNPAGEFVLECDRDKGEIYIRPVGESDKPINLFVSSAQATYTLLLRRADTPADTIVIHDKTTRTPPPGLAPSTSQGPSSNHIRAMKAMLVAMASDTVPQDMSSQEVTEPVQLWADSRFTLVRRYEGRGLRGEKYQLQNLGTSVMVLAEQEFDREDGQVSGIAVEHHNLNPGDTTSVFILRRERAR